LIPFFAAAETLASLKSTKFPVFSLLTGNFRLSAVTEFGEGVTQVLDTIGDDVGMVGGEVARHKERLAHIGFGDLRHDRGAQSVAHHRQIADIMLVELASGMVSAGTR